MQDFDLRVTIATCENSKIGKKTCFFGLRSWQETVPFFFISLKGYTQKTSTFEINAKNKTQRRWVAFRFDVIFSGQKLGLVDKS